jgi:hypothetical protein
MSFALNWKYVEWLVLEYPFLYLFLKGILLSMLLYSVMSIILKGIKNSNIIDLFTYSFSGVLFSISVIIDIKTRLLISDGFTPAYIFLGVIILNSFLMSYFILKNRMESNE